MAFSSLARKRRQRKLEIEESNRNSVNFSDIIAQYGQRSRNSLNQDSFGRTLSTVFHFGQKKLDDGDDTDNGQFCVSTAERQQQHVVEIDKVSEVEEMALTGIEPVDNIRRKIYNVVVKDTFQSAIIAMILLNSILMGIATYLPEHDTEEYNDASKSIQNAVDIIAIIDFAFLVVFTIELILNVTIFLDKVFKDKWLLFDAAIITVSWAFYSFVVMRSFRIFRMFRLFGRLKPLKQIVGAVASTAEGLTSIVFVLFILFYIFAVMFTELYKECWNDCCYAPDYDLCIEMSSQNIEPSPDVNGVNYFGRMDFTVLTLFALMTFDDFFNIIRLTEKENEFAPYLIICFMLVSGLVMLNLTVAVLCEALNNLNEQKEKDNTIGQQKNGKLYDLVVQVKLNGKLVNINGIPHEELLRYFKELYDEKEYYKMKDDQNEDKLIELNEMFDEFETLVLKTTARIGAVKLKTSSR